MTNNVFTKEKTNLSKGVACLLLLFHHLFYSVNIKSYTPFFVSGAIINNTAVMSRVCVSMFLILSGYGLSKSYQNNQMKNPVKFTIIHLVKLMLNFWFIFITFGLLSFVFGQDTPIDVYGTGFGGGSFAIIDFLGLADMFQTPTLNATWWFMSAIILFYILFVPLRTIIKKYSIEGLMVVFLIARVIDFHSYVIYLFAFATGIFLLEENIIEKIYDKLSTVRRIVIFGLGTIIMAYIRLYMGIVVDTLFGFCIIILSVSILEKLSYIRRGVEFIGKHSSNIFMMHTFIYLYFFNDFVYSLKRPVYIFAFVLASSLLTSVVIEWIKKITRYNKLINWIRQKIGA